MAIMLTSMKRQYCCHQPHWSQKSSAAPLVPLACSVPFAIQFAHCRKRTSSWSTPMRGCAKSWYYWYGAQNAHRAAWLSSSVSRHGMSSWRHLPRVACRRWALHHGILYVFHWASMKKPLLLSGSHQLIASIGTRLSTCSCIRNNW